MQPIFVAIVAFSLISITASVQDVELRFSTQTPVVGTFIEGTCEFETTTAGQTVSSIIWTHNSSIQLSHGGRITITTTPSLSGSVTSGTSILEIDGIQHNDAGDYSCKVVFSNPSLEKTSNNVQLSVASELVVNADSEQTAVEGDLAQLRCNVTSNPPPRIRWLRIEEDGSEKILADQTVQDSDSGVYMYNVSTSVSVSQAGTYRCTGRYSFGVKNEDIELVVLTVPVITSEPQDLTVLYNNTVQLNCNATGIKEPTYRWLFDETELVDEGEGGRVRVNTDQRYLKLESVSYDDDGEYVCVAETGAGSDNITHTLRIEGPPEILLPERQDREVVVAGNSLVELKCPFRSLPPPTVKWDKVLQGDKREEINSLAGGFTIFQENGSLLIWNVSQSQASHYDCVLSNKHGSDNRTFFLRVIELPYPPKDLTVVERGGDFIRLSWTPAVSSDIRPIDQYLLILTYHERQNITNTRNVSSELTLYLADNLVPGVEYNITLRSYNLAGVSTPTGSVYHKTDTAKPRLEFFIAESLGDGRSVLLQWRLQYSGGYPINLFMIKVKIDGELKETLEPDVYDESLLLDDLRPTTDYMFEAVVGNSFHGSATPIISNVSTPIAAPGRPTTPEQEERSPQTLTLSFSVKQGSYPINYYLLLVSEPSDLTNTTYEYTNDTEFTEKLMNISSQSVRRQEPWREDGEMVGYHVQLRVSGLEQRQSYVFSVAAANKVGIGEFSQSSRPLTLEDGELLLYLIVFGVLGGVVLLLVILVVVCFVCQYIKRQHRGGKITITRRGSDSTGVATDYNLKFESFNGVHSNQGTTSPNPSQRVDSTTPPPRITSPRVTSPFLSNAHYYNSLRKYQLDTLPAVRQPDDGKERVVEVQVHSNIRNGAPQIKKSGSDAVDGAHYSRPTSHPPSLPPSSQPPPFLPPPSLPSSSTLPSLPAPTSPHQKHPSYNHPTSKPLYNVPRKGNYSQMMSMSALPTTDEGRGQVLGVIGSGANTLPRGMTSSDDYTVMQRVPDGEGRGSLIETGRKFHSMDPKTTGSINVSEEAMHQGYQTDV